MKVLKIVLGALIVAGLIAGGVAFADEGNAGEVKVLRGKITSIGEDSFTLLTKEGEVEVKVSEDTKFIKRGRASFEDLEVGDRAIVKLLDNEAKIVVAFKRFPRRGLIIRGEVKEVGDNYIVVDVRGRERKIEIEGDIVKLLIIKDKGIVIKGEGSIEDIEAGDKVYKRIKPVRLLRLLNSKFAGHSYRGPSL